MILVTGTMRSGTSMWMQILIAAGFPHIGDAFPAPWGRDAQRANPRGFYESQLTAGIYYATNPHPESGAYLFPAATRRHVVKTFIPGLVRTDVAFIDRVIATVRPWREVGASLAAMADVLPNEGHATIAPGLRWWAENFALVRDIATRGYAAHVVTYARLLADPEREVGLVMRWLGEGDVATATRAVDRALHRSVPAQELDPGVDPQDVAILDELYLRIHEERPLDATFIRRLNETDARLRPRLERFRDSFRGEILTVLTAASPSERGA